MSDEERLSGHVIGLLKEYMQDLVEQARQDDHMQQSFGFSPARYGPDQAISDLLAILDDRIESEGAQVGLRTEFLHRMWTLCNAAQSAVAQRVWLEQHFAGSVGKAEMRELTYRALLEYLERAPEGGS